MNPIDPSGLPGRPVNMAEQQEQYETLPAIELFVWTFGSPLQPVYLRVQGIEEPVIAKAKGEADA